MRTRHLLWILVCFAIFTNCTLEKKKYDLVIYGGTSAAVIAAVQAAKMDASIIIVCPDSHLGGMTSGGLGAMGYGFPAALGVQVAKPNDIVIDIAGDGSILMNIQELTTVVENNLPVKIAILNNNFLGMVRQWQQLLYERRYSATDLSAQPDFVRVAEAFGAVGFRATKPEEVEPVIRQAMETPRPVIMDFVVDREECVMPMVPPGKATHEMLLA